MNNQRPIDEITKASKPSIDSNLLNNSIKYLMEYRKLQAKKLQIRLKIFTKVAIDKFGSVDKIKQDHSAPIESQRDIDVINKLIGLETFATIPVFTDDGTAITHFYTIGLWYYWGIPEIVFRFDTPLKENTEFISVIVNIIHDRLFAMYSNRIVTQKPADINRINFETEPEKIVLELENFGVDFKMTRVDNNQYMDIKAMFMLWFYMYYMDAINNEKDEPCLYPVYQINIDNAEYSKTCKIIFDKLLNMAVTKSNTDSQDDTETETGFGSDTESESEDSRLSTIHEHEGLCSEALASEALASEALASEALASEALASEALDTQIENLDGLRIHSH